MNRPVLIIAAGVLVVLVAIGANFVLWQQEASDEPTIATTTEPRAVDDPPPPPKPAEMSASASGSKTKAAPVPSPKTGPTSTPKADSTAAAPQTAASASASDSGPKVGPTLSSPSTTASESTPPTEATATEAEQTASVPESKASKPSVRRPSFDVVRVTPEGETVMAGRAEPGMKTRIVDRGKVIGEVVADPRGEWVFVPETPLPPGDSQITLETDTDQGKTVESDSAVVLLVPEEGRDIAGRPAGEASQPLVLKIQRDDPTTGKPLGERRASIVLQGPTGGSGAPTAGLAVDAVDYDPDGQLSISGRAVANATVQIYLSNRFLGRVTANAGGVWSLIPDGAVDPGIYALRADQIDAKGQVTARVEIPFSRAEPLPLGPGRFIIVQPGNSLWRIARRTYGSGFAFATIYDANAGQIADPDLIYPGQIFQLPTPQ